jgi:hypothetical protein
MTSRPMARGHHRPPRRHAALLPPGRLETRGRPPRRRDVHRELLRLPPRGAGQALRKSEKAAKLAQKLGQLQPFTAVFPYMHSYRNAWANLSRLGQPDIVLAEAHSMPVRRRRPVPQQHHHPGLGRRRSALSAPPRGGYAPLAFSYVNRFCMGLLYGRAGRLTAKNGGFRRGQGGRGRATSGLAFPIIRGIRLRTKVHRTDRFRTGLATARWPTSP